MGGKVKAPEVTAEEKLLQKNQAELLALQREMIEQQRSQNAVLLPFLAKQEGFDVTTDEDGNITAISESAEAQARKAQGGEIQDLLNKRSLAALKGELPVDPALEEDLRVQERDIRNKLSTQLGPGYETSTPGIETLNEFTRTAEILRSGARTGQLTLAEQLGITREQQEQFKRNSSQDVLRTSAISDPMSFAGAFGQTAKGFGQAQVPFIQNRQMQMQASIANQQSKMSMFGAGIGAIGAMFSDDEGKTDMVRIGSTPQGIPIYQYTRIDTGERMIGCLSSDVEKVIPGAVYERGGWDAVQYRDVD